MVQTTRSRSGTCSTLLDRTTSPQRLFSPSSRTYSAASSVAHVANTATLVCPSSSRTSAGQLLASNPLDETSRVVGRKNHSIMSIAYLIALLAAHWLGADFPFTPFGLQLRVPSSSSLATVVIFRVHLPF